MTGPSDYYEVQTIYCARQEKWFLKSLNRLKDQYFNMTIFTLFDKNTINKTGKKTSFLCALFNDNNNNKNFRKYPKIVSVEHFLNEIWNIHVFPYVIEFGMLVILTFEILWPMLFQFVLSLIHSLWNSWKTKCHFFSTKCFKISSVWYVVCSIIYKWYIT